MGHFRLILHWIITFLACLVWSSAGLCGYVRDETGREVFIPHEIKRVVSLAPSITECLFALGLGEVVVGVTRFSNYPPEVRSREKVGSYIRINLERVLSLRPDLVIATRDGNPREAVERLAEMGPPVYVVDPRNLEGLFRTLTTLGRIFHREKQAQSLVYHLRGRVGRIQHLLQGRRRPRVFLQIGTDPLVTVGNGTLQDVLIRLAGGANIAATESVAYPVLSVEYVLKAAPEIILVSSMTERAGAEEQIKRWQRWSEIPAVSNGRLYVINGDLIDRPSPRALDGLEEMVRCIHPEPASRLTSEQSGSKWKE